jgi:hypothetical protein
MILTKNEVTKNINRILADDGIVMRPSQIGFLHELKIMLLNKPNPDLKDQGMHDWHISGHENSLDKFSVWDNEGCVADSIRQEHVARIISAAPDMHDALQKCIRTLEIALDRELDSGDTDTLKEFMDTVDQANLALIKAGEIYE